MKHIGLLLSVLLLLSSCHTTPTEIPEELSQGELIQLAQNAADQRNWNAAIAYYQAIVERFGDDRGATAVARYEIAFIRYKRGEFDGARAGFTELLGMYDLEAGALPEWPRVLARRLLAEMDEAGS